jgi:hypothetical protein
VVIKVFFAVLVLCTLAVVAVIMAIHFRVKRHLRQNAVVPPSSSEAEPDGVEIAGQVLPNQNAVENTAQENGSKPAS